MLMGHGCFFPFVAYIRISEEQTIFFPLSLFCAYLLNTNYFEYWKAVFLFLVCGWVSPVFHPLLEVKLETSFTGLTSFGIFYFALEMGLFVGLKSSKWFSNVIAPPTSGIGCIFLQRWEMRGVWEEQMFRSAWNTSCLRTEVMEWSGGK